MTPKIREQMELSGGRRFILAMGAGITTTFLQWMGKLDAAGTTYATVVIATVAAYITGNTVQKSKATSKEDADA
jgi:hypothetical protein